MNKIKLLFGGDFGIVGDAKWEPNVDEGVLELFRDSQLNTLDLECPVTSNIDKNRIFKTGPNINGEAEINGRILKKLNTHLLTLANNHILDFGEKGVKDTLNFCAKNGFNSVGAGINLDSAEKPFRFEINGCKISIINFAENEWCSASKEAAGANPMDIVRNTHQIKVEKNHSHYVIVVIHGGIEFYNLPSPRVKNQYRFYAENGADLIVCNHTHCISGWEIYNKTPIFYGLGNFLLTIPFNNSEWYTGLLLEVQIDEKGLNTTLHPIQNSFKFSLKLSEGEEKEQIMQKVSFYSKILQDDILLNNEWDKLLEFEYKKYLKDWSSIGYIGNRYAQAIMYRLKLYKLFINRKRLALHLNLQRCESHSDLSKAILTKYLKKK